MCQVNASSFSDTNGKLLFYLHSKRWESIDPPLTSSVSKIVNVDTISNGDNILSYTSITNGATFIKQQDKVFLFHLNTDPYRPELDGPIPTQRLYT